MSFVKVIVALFMLAGSGLLVYWTFYAIFYDVLDTMISYARRWYHDHHRARNM